MEFLKPRCNIIELVLYVWNDRESKFWDSHESAIKYCNDWIYEFNNTDINNHLKFSINFSERNILQFAGFFTVEQLKMNPVLVNKCTHEAIIGAAGIESYLEMLRKYLLTEYGKEKGSK